MKGKGSRFFAFFIFFILILQSFSVADLNSDAAETGLFPNLKADNAVVVYNIDSDQVLFQNRGDEVVAPTAATKLVSMMVVWDILSENKIDPAYCQVTANANDLKNIGSLGDKSAPRIGITAGNTFTATELITASILANANDACSVIVNYCIEKFLAGQTLSFIDRMNKKAADVGASSTKFKNSTGLDQNGMETTPKDVALIAAAFYKYNDLAKISNQDRVIIGGKSTIHAKNYLLSDMLIKDYKNKQAIGLIAGQRTDTSEYALITAAEKEGLTYIIVIMCASGEIRNPDGTRSFGTGNAYDDAGTLINWAKESFGYKTLIEEGTPIAELRVNMGKNYDYLSVVPEKKVENLINNRVEVSRIEKTITFDSNLVYKSEYNKTVVNMINAPVTKGQVIGKMTLTYEGLELCTVNLVALQSIDSSGLLSTANKAKDFLFGKVMKTILIIFAVIIVAYVIFSIVAAIVRGVNKAKASKRRKLAKHAELPWNNQENEEKNGKQDPKK